MPRKRYIYKNGHNSCFAILQFIGAKSKIFGTDITGVWNIFFKLRVFFFQKQKFYFKFKKIKQQFWLKLKTIISNNYEKKIKNDTNGKIWRKKKWNKFKSSEEQNQNWHFLFQGKIQNSNKLHLREVFPSTKIWLVALNHLNVIVIHLSSSPGKC